jgi:hypothetical protein
VIFTKDLQRLIGWRRSLMIESLIDRAEQEGVRAAITARDGPFRDYSQAAGTNGLSPRRASHYAPRRGRCKMSNNGGGLKFFLAG